MKTVLNYQRVPGARCEVTAYIADGGDDDIDAKEGKTENSGI
jgi:hypothetical protein